MTGKANQNLKSDCKCCLLLAASLVRLLFGVDVGIVYGAEIRTPIILAPMKAEAGNEAFQLNSASRILTDAKSKDSAKLLAARLRLATGYPFKTKSAENQITAGDILLTTNGADAVLDAEGYELSVTTNGVVIRAPTPA
jgi:hypothetical protein